MRGRAAELLCGARRGAPLFGEVSTEARARVGVDLSRVSAGLLVRGFARARRAAGIDHPSSTIRRHRIGDACNWFLNSTGGGGAIMIFTHDSR